MNKDKLISLIEAIDMKKNSDAYKYQFVVSVLNPFLSDLQYPLFDMSIVQFDGELCTFTVEIEGSNGIEPLKTVFSLTPLHELKKSSSFDGADYIMVFLTNTNVIEFYTYGMGDYHLINRLEVKKMDATRYNKFISFLNYNKLKEMYLKHGRKLATSSLLDMMFKRETLGNNKFIQAAVKDIFENSPDELFKLVADYLVKNYTFNSSTNILKELKKSKGTLLDAVLNSDSGDYASGFDDSLEEVDDSNSVFSSSPVADVADLDGFNPKELKDVMQLEDKEDIKLDNLDDIDALDEVVVEKEDIAELEEFPEVEESYAVDIYETESGLDSFLDDTDEIKERNIPNKTSNNLGDFFS